MSLCSRVSLMSFIWCLALAAAVQGQTLEADLLRASAKELAQAAIEQGDAARGAVVFFQYDMTCAKCHAAGPANAAPFGPDLTAIGKEATNEAIVESILTPSKAIRKGFESVTVLTNAGRTVAGLLVERNEARIVIRELARGGENTVIPAAEIDTVTKNELSLMPAGQVNQLTSRQQFLDLVRYVIDIRDGGAARARELQPAPALIAQKLPEYEKHIDHAGLIGDWNEKSLKRGEAIYNRVCRNCHGTPEQPGSLPNSLRFAEGKFKNGGDPHSMYQTLTRGFGLMAAQSWMVPSQKYDVIHYIRETYLRPHNRSQLTEVNAEYLARLPIGDTRGPAPSKIEPWSAMDYGPSLTHTYEIPGAGKEKNFAYKGIAIRLDPGSGGVSRGRRWMLFDTDTLRVAAAWSADKKEPKFMNWRGIQFNGEHQIHPSLVGRFSVVNSVGPGVANPSDGSFADEARVVGRDGRRYGPLPRAWARFRGLYHHGHHVVLSYSIGDTEVLESPRWAAASEASEEGSFVRMMNFGPRARDITLKLADANDDLHIHCVPSDVKVEIENSKSGTFLKIPAGKEAIQFAIAMSSEKDVAAPNLSRDELDLAPLTRGGPARWPQTLTSTAVIGKEDGPLAVDTLTTPDSNPWLAQMRFTGLDFFADGRLAVSTWDGDVWVVSRPDAAARLTWRRVATGMFQPLGVRVINEKIHVTCRDQLSVLHDLNGDGEIDYYECLNNDHQVTEHFHEFAMGLQTDAQGNFYYAKSARHALPAVVPHHGTLLRVSADGSKTEILANGFRAANGVCLNPDGSFVVTDQEGHWNPKNRINWVRTSTDGRPRFYGNMFGYHDRTDSSDSAMEPPLCWITNAFDRSPGELMWIQSPKWGTLNGSLLNLSYGTGKVFLVPHETIGGQPQGGMIELPIPAFPTGVMRGRIHPEDQALYLCGMFAWAGSATQPGGFYRIRPTGKPSFLPIGLHAGRAGLKLTFTEPLDPASVSAEKVQVKTWSLKRTQQYGSKHFDEKTLSISAASLSADGKTLTLTAEVQPTWCMEIRYDLKSKSGEPVIGTIHNTIHTVGD